MNDNDRTVSEFDRILGALHGLPDVTPSKLAQRQIVPPFGINSSLYIVQTYRQRDKGDTIFIQVGEGDRLTRIAIPPEVAEIIARQREQLTAKVRSKVSKAAMQARKDRGEVVGFQKKGTK